MITLLIGNKGAGKTKKLIDVATKALENTNGNVVVIEKGAKLTYDISHKARLIDTDSYGIMGADALVGFISGICAANYDVTDILVDSTLKIIGKDLAVLDAFIGKLKTLNEIANTKITLSVSVGEDELPADLADLVAK